MNIEKKLKAPEGVNVIDKSNKRFNNNSDATDLSSTKSAQRIWNKNIDQSNSMKVKLSHTSSQNENVQKKLQKKPSLELTVKTTSEMKFHNVDVPELGTDLFWVDALHSKDSVSKEVVIDTTKDIVSEISNQLFSNDLSWIKSKDVTVKNKKDNSEIYDQLIDEGKLTIYRCILILSAI